MPLKRNKLAERSGVRVHLSVYRCRDCAGCPLANACLSRQSKSSRTITRDEYEPARERTAARMATPEGREVYQPRAWVAETPFAILKAVMGNRQFLLRGLEKVKTEWLWAVTSFNLAKLVREIKKLRAESAQLA